MLCDLEAKLFGVSGQKGLRLGIPWSLNSKPLDAMGRNLKIRAAAYKLQKTPKGGSNGYHSDPQQ